MKKTYLEFEKSIESIETKIESLKAAQDDHPSIDINTELKQLEKKADKSLHDIYDNLSAWQISQVARHPQRPYTQDYIEHIFTDFEELHGDRSYGDDHGDWSSKRQRCERKTTSKLWHAQTRRLP